MNQTEAKILEIQERMRTWNDFVREIKVPAEIAPAFQTGRIELIKLARPRALSAEECGALYDVIGGLLETNQALKEHAQLVGDLVATTHQGLKGAVHAVERMRRFAAFEEPVEEEVQT